jgi:hypothetical protein
VERFRANSLLENVNLHVAYLCYIYEEKRLDERVLRRVLIHILPLIGSVNSIQIDCLGIDLFNMVYSNNNINIDHDNGPDAQLLLKGMMAQTRILFINWLDERSLLVSLFF